MLKMRPYDEKIRRFCRQCNNNRLCPIVCNLLSNAALHVVLDLTWSPLATATRRTLAAARLPHFRLDITGRPPVAAATRWLHARAASDAILVFADERTLTEGLYQLMHDSLIRCIAYAGLSAQTAQRIQRLRPVPTYTMIVAGAQTAADMLDVAQRHELLKRPDTWNVLLLDDFDDAVGAVLRDQYAGVSVLVPAASMCCRMLDEAADTATDGENGKKCACGGSVSTNPMPPIDTAVLGEFMRVLLDCLRDTADGTAETPVAYECPADGGQSEDRMEDDDASGDDEMAEPAAPLLVSVLEAIRSKAGGLLRASSVDDGTITYHVEFTAWSVTNTSVQSIAVAHVNADNVTALMMQQPMSDEGESAVQQVRLNCIRSESVVF